MMATAPPAASASEDRKRALLLQARRERLAWVLDEDYEAPEPLADALLHEPTATDGGALPSGWRRGRVSEVLGGGEALQQLLPTAAEYVAFLNRLAGEADVEAVQYPASALLPKLPGDAELLRGGDDESDEEEERDEEAAAMPPLPPLPTRGGEELTYEAFVARLGHPLSSEAVGALQRFVGAFVRRQRQRAQAQQEQEQGNGGGMGLLDLDGGIEALAAGMHAFIDGLRAEMRKSPAWRALVAEEGRQEDQLLPPTEAGRVVVGQWEEVRDHLETFLVTKLHRYLFTPRERAALAAQDAALSGRLRALAFLGPEHLDVRSLLGGPTNNHHEHPQTPPPISKTLAPAIAAFSRAIEQRAPRAVLDHLLAASRLVTRALVAARRDGTLPGADEVLPALILVIKESNPPGLRSALERVARFRHPRKLQVSEAAYVFTNVASAVHFLETADAAQLNMAPDDLERSLAACRLNDSPALQQQPLTTSSSPRPDDFAGPTPRASSHSLSDSSLPGGLNSNLLSTTRILEAVEGQTTAAAPPARLVSIQEIRQQRRMAKVAVPSPSIASPPPVHKARPQPASRITELAARVQHAVAATTTSPRRIAPPRVSPSDVLAGCRFLQAAPEEVRLAEVGALLEEHRALAALAADLARLLEGQEGRGGW